MAKTLAQEGTVLLLDEATSAMDIHRKLQIFRCSSSSTGRTA